MNKPDDIVEAFADPISQQHSNGCVRLIELIRDYGVIQKWKVAYVNVPKMEFEIFIKA